MTGKQARNGEFNFRLALADGLDGISVKGLTIDGRTYVIGRWEIFKDLDSGYIDLLMDVVEGAEQER